ncbi:MAG: precorrin-6A synthase (deacetylating) [Roseiarcus sp.]
MRKILIIGIGAGHPDHVTVQAVKALNTVDVFFSIDKGPDKDDLARLRREICAAHIVGRAYRTAVAPDPGRDRAPPAYEATVKDWHDRRADLFEAMIAGELGEDETGAFLVWGDPSLYDSTLRIVEAVAGRGAIPFDFEVIPGVTSVQALAAAHRIALNRIGGPVHITTGRNLAAGRTGGDLDNVVVMLDGQNAFEAIAPDGVEIYWGAYVGTEDQILIAGDLRAVGGEIARRRAEARARKGWIMDVYLLRQRGRE